MTAEVINVPEGATVLIEHVHIDMSLNLQIHNLTAFHKITWMIPTMGYRRMAFYKRQVPVSE